MVTWGLKRLKDLEQLSELDISETKATKAGLQHLKKVGMTEEVKTKKNSRITLTLTRVRGLKRTVTEIHGRKEKKVREVLFACDVEMDNESGEHLIVCTGCFSVFDGLGLAILKDGVRSLE